MTNQEIKVAASKKYVDESQRASFIEGANWALNNIWKKTRPKLDGEYIVLNTMGCVGTCAYSTRHGWYDDFFGTIQKINNIILWAEKPKKLSLSKR